LCPGTLAAAVLATHRVARVDDYSTVEGPMGDAARAGGLGSGCAAPIMVDGRLWGQMCVFSTPGKALPAGIEDQLADFVKLVATAISNYDARARLRMVAAEQAALRRVATLVARGATADGVFPAVATQVGGLPAATDVFAAVTEEIAAVLGADASMLCRVDPDGTAVVVGTWADGSLEPAHGTRIPQGGTNLITIVLETGRSARIENYDEATGDA